MPANNVCCPTDADESKRGHGIEASAFAEWAGLSMGYGRGLNAICPCSRVNVAGFPAVKVEEVHRHDVNRLMEVKS